MNTKIFRKRFLLQIMLKKEGMSTFKQLLSHKGHFRGMKLYNRVPLLLGYLLPPLLLLQLLLGGLVVCCVGRWDVLAF